MVTRAQLQPDHVEEDSHIIAKRKAIDVNNNVAQNINNQYPCRFVYNQSSSDLNILKQEISASTATCKEWLTASDRCKPVIPGKSYTEVLKTDLVSMHAKLCKKWSGHPAKVPSGQVCGVGEHCTH